MENFNPEQKGLLLTLRKLESVARNFTSQISGLSELGYWERLQALRMYSQERKRERYGIIFIWKVLQGLVEGYSIAGYQNPRRAELLMLPITLARHPLPVSQFMVHSYLTCFPER